MPEPPSVPRAELRPNVCAALTDEPRQRVLVFRRVDAARLGPYRWQFPQGGLKAGEAPEAALRRELREEIGTDAVEVLARLPEPIAYLYPSEVLAALRAQSPEKGRYLGQSQHWFLVRLQVPPVELRFDHDRAEFDAWEWVTPQEALSRVVPFKQAAYREALAAFGLLEDGAS